METSRRLIETCGDTKEPEDSLKSEREKRYLANMAKIDRRKADVREARIRLIVEDQV